MGRETKNALDDVEGSRIILFAALLAIPQFGKVDNVLVIFPEKESRLLQFFGTHKLGHRVLVPGQPFKETRFQGDGDLIVDIESLENVAGRLHTAQRWRTVDVLDRLLDALHGFA